MDPHPARRSPQHKEGMRLVKFPRPSHGAFADARPGPGKHALHPSSVGLDLRPIASPSLLRRSDPLTDPLSPDRELAANQDFVLGFFCFPARFYYPSITFRKRRRRPSR